MSGPVFASDLTIPQSTLYPYRSTIELQDDFIGGISSTGNIGDLGFTFNNGAVTTQSSVSNRIGIIRLDSSAVINTIASLLLGNTALGTDPSTPTRQIWVVRLNTNDANTTARVGAMNSAAASPPADGIYLEKLDADTNWFCVNRAGGAQTRTASGVAVSTNFVTIMYQRDSSGVQFYIDQVAVCGTVSTTIPTVFLRPATQIVTSAAAAKTIDHDYFQLIIQGLTR